MLIFNYNSNIHSRRPSINDGAFVKVLPLRWEKSQRGALGCCAGVTNKRFYSTIKVKDVELCPN
jgi:hypothetical protein